jgi:nickel superoxide dismutase
MEAMNLTSINLKNIFKPEAIAFAHCDLPCGVYDPAQAKIEAH